MKQTEHVPALLRDDVGKKAVIGTVEDAKRKVRPLRTELEVAEREQRDTRNAGTKAEV